MNTAASLRHFPRRHGPGRQRGISMFIVMIILLLALILVFGGLTVTNMNESLVGNQSDAQRAYGSAQALINAAQRDIRLNGRDCGPVDTAPPGTAGQNPYYPLTSAATTNCTVRFPRNMAEYTQLQTKIMAAGKCASNSLDAGVYEGICFSDGPTDPNFLSATVNDGAAGIQQWANGATYTQFVGKLDDNGDAGVNYGSNSSNSNVATGSGTSLALSGASVDTDKGRYWIEVFPYNTASISLGDSGGVPLPDSSYPFVFRITALARGLRGDTVSLLRAYYVPYPGNYGQGSVD